MTVQTEDGVPLANLKAVRGDTFVRTVYFEDTDGNPINITGWTLFFTVKDNLNEGDASAEVAKTITSHTTPASGLTEINVPASEMASLAGDYDYDIQIKKADGTIFTILRGKLTVETDVSVRTS